jgi:predicted amidohydrolase
VFNTSVLINRNGSLNGFYRKTHLPLAEIENGLSPGSDYPVFDTDFARIGMIICWDTAFPEPTRRMKLAGAELITNATMGDFWPMDRARAKENGVWMAISGAGRTAGAAFPQGRVYDPTGELVAAAGDGESDTFALAEIDFNKRYYQFWASVGPSDGEPPSLYVRERRPETY